VHSRLLDHFFDISTFLGQDEIFHYFGYFADFHKNHAIRDFNDFWKMEVANDSGESGQLHAIPLFIKS
jgi:hypothetical protein